MEISPERGSQARQVRQRQNPEKVSELTSIRELLQEIAQDTHDGRHQIQACEVLPALSAILAYEWRLASAGTPSSEKMTGESCLLPYSTVQCQSHAAH